MAKEVKKLKAVYSKEFKSKQGTRKFSFGKCIIDSIEQSKNAKDWFLIHLKQIVQIDYTGSGKSSGFALQNKSEHKDAISFSFQDTRTKTERVTKAVLEGDEYEEGQEIEGMLIRRQCWDEPQWDDQKPGFNGKYFTTDLIDYETFEEEGGDQYNNEEGMPVSEKMMEAKKAASKSKKKSLVKAEEEED